MKKRRRNKKKIWIKKRKKFLMNKGFFDRVAREFFPVKHACRRQGADITVRQFDLHLNCMNDYLQYFPMVKSKGGSLRKCPILGKDQLCDIINLAKKPEWTLKMMEANVDPYDLDLSSLLDYLE